MIEHKMPFRNSRPSTRKRYSFPNRGMAWAQNMT
ncbi:hypothetical protein SLEP1_g58537 [Rubroshorea leprosula]|uniref:Uncharacterized protein n=1 Tax=Rubroshorea leprosula TaxID=152421 RepID=A0AAV5MPL5_9ROSI|nr:hypothetical protein SLEP1_g58537 [Rubroshorea leprosula]